MNEKDAWKSFTDSGSVNDYLRYALIKKEQENAPEEKNEIQYGRTGYSRTEYKGTGQSNHYSDKK